MNEELQKLYNVLSEKGYYTKSYDEFQTKWSNEEYRKKVFDVTSRDGLYTKTYDEFLGKYKPVDVKKKDSTEVSPGAQDPSSTSSDGEPEKKVSASVTSDIEGKTLTDYPYRKGNHYKFENGTWYRSTPTKSKANLLTALTPGSSMSGWQEIKNRNSINELNKYYRKPKTEMKGTADAVGTDGYVSPARKTAEFESGLYQHTRTFGEQTEIPALQETQSNKRYAQDKINNLNQQKAADLNAAQTDEQREQVEKTYEQPLKEAESELQQVKDVESTQHERFARALKHRGVKDIDAKFDAITEDFMSIPEEEAVPMLEEAYSRYGFNFEETGMGDAVRITSKRGNTIEIDLQSDEFKNLKQWLSDNQMSPEEIERVSGMSEGEYRKWQIEDFAENPYTYNEKQTRAIQSQMKKQVQGLGEFYTKYQKEGEQIVNRMNEINEAVLESGGATPEQIEEFKRLQDQLAKHEERGVEVEKELLMTEKLSKAVNVSAYKLVEHKAKEAEETGSTLGGVWNSLLGGVTDVAQAGSSIGSGLAIDITGAGSVLAPEIISKLQEKGLSEYQIEDFAKKYVNKISEKNVENILDMIGSETTPEYMSSEDRGFWEEVLFGVARTAPALAAGALGGPAGMLTLSAQSYNQIQTEMNQNPEFARIPEHEKMIVAAPYAIAMGALENYGFSKLFSENPYASTFLNKVVSKVLKEAPENATQEFIEMELKKTVAQSIKDGSIRLIGGAVVEGETGALQAVAELGIKDVYNAVKGKEMFDTPEGFTERLGYVAESAASEAAGALIMRGFQETANIAANGFAGSNINNETAKLLQAMNNDADARSLYVNDLKLQVLQGDLTPHEATVKKDQYDSVMARMSEIPGTVENVGKAYDLLTEKDNLNQIIEGKDPNLVAKEKERVAEIDEELKQLSQPEIKEETETPKVELPEEMSKKFTTTEEGDVVVHHFSHSRKESLDPSITTGAGLQTSREEAAALNSVGGVTMFYTEAGQKEMGVGDVQHTVRIRPEKIYPFKEDPLNFYEEAKKQFKEKMGENMAFDPNYQAAWITKVAVDNGFDAVAIPWRTGYRIQTTKSLTPEETDIDFKDKKQDLPPQVGDTYNVYGTDVTITNVTEDGTYEFEGDGSTGTFKQRQLGTGQAKLVSRAKADIVKTHEEQGGSSISQTGENLYGKPGFSVSIHTDRSVKIPGRSVTQDQINEFTEKNKDLLESDPNNYVGTWYDSKTDQTYIDVSTYVKDRDTAIKMGQEANQKAIFDLESGEEIDTGGTGEDSSSWVKDTSKSILESSKTFYKKWLSAKKFLPKSAFAAKEQMEADIAVELNKVDRNTKDFNRAYKKYKGDKEQLLKDFDAFLRGEKVELPDEFTIIGNSMRNQIDNLSLSFINSGLVAEDLASVVRSNIGSYLTRSYKVYDRENWKNEVEQEVKQKAENYLKKEYREMAEDQAAITGMDADEILDNIVSRKMKSLLEKEGASDFAQGSKLGSKDTSVFKERMDIPFEIRALMGEYGDPALNYAKTVLKMSALAANHKFLKTVRNEGLGVWLFEENDPRRTAEYNTRIAAEGSESMSPLNGLYASKEVAEEFMASATKMSDFMQMYMKTISTIKWMKTIGSFATHAKNIFGNLGFVWLNGHHDLTEMGKAYTAIRSDLKGKDKKMSRELMDKYISLGIVKQSAGLGEIQDMFKDANFDDAMAERLSNKKHVGLDKYKKFLTSRAAKTKKWAEDWYQAEDDFFKIVAFENEMSRYSKAMTGKGKEELTPEEYQQVSEHVAEIVKNTYPTYSRVPEAVKLVRRFPFVGNFISFQAEAYRTAANTAALARQEITSENPEIRKIGAKRLTGAVTYMSAKTALLSYFSMAAGTGLTGILGWALDDEEEKQREADIRQFIAPWSKKSDLLLLRVGDGKVKYIDFSSSDPHGGLNRVINAFALGQSSTDGFVDSLIEFLGPFVEEEMTMQALLGLRTNTDAYGRDIWNPEASRNEIVSSILGYVWKVVQPGTVTSINRVMKSDEPTAELVSGMTGYRVSEIDVAKQFTFKVRDIQARVANAARIYNKAHYNDEATPEEVEAAYNEANEAYMEIYSELIDVYNSAERLGVDRQQLMSTLKDMDLGNRVILHIRAGKVPELKRKGRR